MGTLHDAKYGPIEIPRETQDGEPCFVLRGQDVLAPMAIDIYARLVHAAALGASGDQAVALLMHGTTVLTAAETMRAWQEQHPARLPD